MEIVAAAQRRTRSLVRGSLDLLFPPLCVACHARVDEAHALCPSCWRTVSFLDGPCCVRCGLPFEIDTGEDTICAACHAKPRAFDRARSLFAYDEASKPLILAFKYSDRLDHAPAFARWLERAGRPLLAEADIVLPVPLHRLRLWRRRYNQAAVLGERLARFSGKPHDPMLLRRKRPTPSQGMMASAKARRRNVLGAFEVPAERRADVREKRLLLVDDVFTTGATLEACARALKRAGAARVDVLTLARVVRPSGSDI
jgi:ComF family protein